ncbi:MAG: hypothetical protein JXL84_15080 [Deltaproteobacteria bacterium]|nr:hypothetical protein [Deltaproteobacteria bacterium]
MPLPLIGIAASLAARYAPQLIGWLAGDRAEETAEKVVGIAKDITGVEDPEAALRALESNPELALKYQEALMNYELERYREGTKRIGIVNQTMQTESKSEHWPQYSWRPFNGFTFPMAILLIYFVLPAAGKIVPSVPELVWIGWLSILGVATWDRGKEKRAMTGEGKPGLLQTAINAVRGK